MRIDTAMRAARRLFVVLAAAGIAGEAGLRVWDHFHGKTGSLYDYVVQVGTRFKMRPGVAVIVPERYGDIRYSFNRDGYRDVDHDPAKPCRRLLLLGDSVTFGLGVAQDRTYAARIARELAARQPPWETVNQTIFAYDTRHELETLEEDGLGYRPDVILLQFYMNDFSISSPHPRAAAGSWGDRLLAAKNRLLYKSALYLRAQQLLLGASYLLLHDARRRYFPQTLNADEPRAQTAYLAAHPGDASLPTFTALGAIGRVARQHGARLLVFITPDEVQLFTPRYDVINRRVADFCRGQGIPVFDPLPVLRAGADRRRLFYDGVHYSDYGHAVVGRLLLAALDRGGFLAAVPGRAPSAQARPRRALGAQEGRAAP
ncbi:MAG TPA: SGNH/GDSL hydrolase family protein [Thermoanaerobaculia bacterium]|jgi:lysophospholipase L1-like esterase|nr:SGNH/GDSL hydrolase family protein [Thermoanaerobaculia bacterium]